MDASTKLLEALKFLDPRSLKHLSDQIMVLIEKKLWAKVLAAMILGMTAGILIGPAGPLAVQLAPYREQIDSLMAWLVFPAKFFLQLIKMVIIPLIFSSIIRGLASTEDVTQMKKLGGKFTLFVLISSIGASLMGIAIAALIQPGKGLSLSGAKTLQPDGSGSALFNFSPDALLNFLPANPIASIVEGQMLEVVILSIIAGIAFLSIDRDHAKSVMDSLEVVQQICMKVISWAMVLAPYAVFGMMTQVTATSGLKSLQNMGLYVLCCFIGFTVLIIIYAFLISFKSRKSPFYFLKSCATPMLLAFSTSSSAATMPVTMKAAEEDLDVDQSTARFLIPLGTTVNMAGSSIWHTSAVMFLGQAYDLNLSVAQITLVVSTSIASAIGSPGVPGVGVGILSAVMMKVGIPVEGVSLIMGVDRIVDMGCTVVNVSGDLCVSKLLGHKKQTQH